MQGHYILVGQTAVPVEPCDPYTPEGREGLRNWALAFEHMDRRVGETWLWFGICRVSTVFLGLDHNFAGLRSAEPHEPLLFETMAFWRIGKHQSYDSHQERCATWAEAEVQHKQIVRACRMPWRAVACLYRAWRERWR